MANLPLHSPHLIQDVKVSLRVGVGSQFFIFEFYEEALFITFFRGEVYFHGGCSMDVTDSMVRNLGKLFLTHKTMID